MAFAILKMARGAEIRKRQLTWFRHVDAKRIMMDDENGNLKDLGDILAEAEEIINTEFKE